MSCDFQFFNSSRFENNPLFRLLIGSKTKEGQLVSSQTPSKPNSLSIKIVDCCLGHSFWDISIYSTLLILFFWISTDWLNFHCECHKNVEKVMIISKIMINLRKIILFYRVVHKYLNPGRGISTIWDTPIIFCMAILIDKINIPWKFGGHRCNTKQNIKSSFLPFL